MAAEHLPTEPTGAQQGHPADPTGWSFVLADDGSLHSSAAAALLGDLPLPPGSHITILSVLSPREPSSRALREQALEETRARFAAQGIESSVVLVDGHPAQVLVDYMQRACPDVVAIGARGMRSALDIQVGGVAQQVLEYGRCPLLVVRAPYEGLRRILLVTDGSAHSRQAAGLLAGSGMHSRFPLPPDAMILVAHVLPPLPSADLVMRSWSLGPELFQPLTTGRLDELLNEQAADEQREGERLVAETSALLRASGLQAEPVVLRGDAASQLIDYARTHSVDLIVAGSRGLSPMKAWLLGSVSRKLVYYAGCSVLVVKGALPADP